MKFEAVNSHTTVDAPETVYHIREVFKDLEAKGIKTTIRMPMYKGKPTSMWKLIEEKKIPPTRWQRYCCEVLKESAAPNRYIATGIRASESKARSSRAAFEVIGRTKDEAKRFETDHVEEVFYDAKDAMYQSGAKANDHDPFDCTFIEKAKDKKKLVCNPIIDWTEKDVWAYIRREGIKVNPLYAKGWRRVGCIGCPLASPKMMQKELSEYPIYRSNYIKAFDRMLLRRQKEGKKSRHTTGKEVLRWWIQDDGVAGQLSIDMDGNIKEDYT